jgi:hypothetical protein
MMPCVIAIPVYRPTLDALEHFSLAYSLEHLQGRPACFVAPHRLDLGYYAEHFPGLDCERFDDAHFASIQGYSRLLLNAAFYERFADFEFTLILQTDAIVLQDDLGHWCRKPYDYVGAPWPEGVEIFVNLDRYGGPFGKRVRTYVGNGGLSLRRNAKCIALLKEFPDATRMFQQSGSSEDLFFGIIGSLSEDFLIPNESVAAGFALELQPRHYHALHGGRLPMGGHAWWRYDPQFWAVHLKRTPPLRAEHVGSPSLGASRVRVTRATA